MIQIIPELQAHRLGEESRMPPEKNPGGGESVETQVLAQHRRLDSLFSDACDAFRQEGTLEAVREVFAELREALETHFDQEDRLYYPAIAALRTELKPQLEAFVESHRRFRQRIESIDDLLTRGDLAAAHRAVETLAAAFEQHEAAEEGVLSTLAREVGAAR
jgi:hemerythrin